jgi:hypothetical protein
MSTLSTSLFLLALVACSRGDQSDQGPSAEHQDDSGDAASSDSPSDDTSSDTGSPQLVVISPGQPVPSILADDDAYDQYAADELADYLSQVTGQTISVVDEAAEGGVVLHVGATDFVDENVDLSELYADGFVVRHVEADGRDHVVLAGNLDLASQWAVEHFLREYAGVHWLFPDDDYGEHVPSADTVTIPASIDDTHEPDYAHRGSLSMYYFNSSGYELRNFANGSGVYGQHALQYIFDEDDYAAHPEWFAWFDGERQWWTYGNGWQICTANEETVTHAVEYCVAYFDDYPDEDTCSIGANDGYGLCTDELCDDLRHSQHEAYSDSEMWWLWVNDVAAQLAEYDDGAYADRWVESLAYSWTSDPPRFALEPNVAITKTIVFDYELDQAEEWSESPAYAQSVNLYSYPMCNSFLGFRHYPTAMADFLVWGRDTLGARAHLPECGPGDWTFDGPKYAYTQALQWDADADPAEIMNDFCAASYGVAAEPMCAFWQRLEDVWEARDASTPYGDEHTRLLFYQWVGWQANSYIPPNDELRTYTTDDVEALDGYIEVAVLAATSDTEEVRYRVARMEEAWGLYRTYLLSKLRYLDAAPAVDVDREDRLTEVRALADEIAQLRADRDRYRTLMVSHPVANVRTADQYYGKLGWMEGFTVFSYEQGLLDEACSAISGYLEETASEEDAVTYWGEVAEDDPLYDHAQTQLYLLDQGPTELLSNGDFESGSPAGWTTTEGSATVSASDPHDGRWSASLAAGTVSISQDVSVSQRDRYRLTVWGRYASDPDDFYVATEARVAFYDASGGALTDLDPTRTMFATTSADDGWTRVVSTMTAPYTASTATITLLKHHDAEMLLDDVSFERILPGPEVVDGELYDQFDGDEVDWEIWYPTSGGTGTEPPRVEDSELIYDSTDYFSINALAAFDELLDHSGEDAYTLKLHLRLLDAADAEGSIAFGIKTGTGPLSINESGFMFYHYWSDPYSGGVGKLNAYCYQDSGNTQTWVATKSTAWDEVYYTIVFEPSTMTVYAATDGYSDDTDDLLMDFEHGVGEVDYNGSVYFKLQGSYNYAVDEVSLESAGASSR